jgi:hypothetical protein
LPQNGRFLVQAEQPRKAWGVHRVAAKTDCSATGDRERLSFLGAYEDIRIVIKRRLKSATDGKNPIKHDDFEREVLGGQGGDALGASKALRPLLGCQPSPHGECRFEG